MAFRGFCIWTLHILLLERKKKTLPLNKRVQLSQLIRQPNKDIQRPDLQRLEYRNRDTLITIQYNEAIQTQPCWIWSAAAHRDSGSLEWRRLCSHPVRQKLRSRWHGPAGSTLGNRIDTFEMPLKGWFLFSIRETQHAEWHFCEQFYRIKWRKQIVILIVLKYTTDNNSILIYIIYIY